MNFQDYQRAFTARIRDPRSAPRPPGAPAARMKVYEELLYNNIEGFLLACFPVSRKLLGQRRWTRMVRAFFRDHVCHTPYFRQIPEEFLGFLQDHWTLPDDFPAFLPELAHYEWVELELDTSDRQAPAHDDSSDLCTGTLVLNPVLRVLAYRWPVQRLSPRFKPTQPPEIPTFLVAWRDTDFDVRFMTINAASARCLSLLQEDATLDIDTLTQRLASELGQPGTALREALLVLLNEWREAGLILGIRT